MKPGTIIEIVKVIEGMDYLENTIFISFALQNLVALREAYPQVKIQYLVEKIEDLPALLEILNKYHFDLDAKHTCIKEEMVPVLHENGIKINVWTVNTVERAERLQQIGVDFITTNIVE
jgi:glycerophosphoryl diester phosphodiesterase